MTLAPETILATDRLTMRFGGLLAVNELDLSVRGGAIHSIIGPNGAGKTTVFNCIMQNLQISAGKIWFRGERMDGLTPDRVAAAGVSRTYQNIRLFRNVTAMENLLVGMHLHLRSHWWGALINSPHTRRSEKEAHDEALKLLRFVGLTGRGDVIARNLAYGEQRRLEMGRALATRPKLLLLDEPTAGMNPRETSEMMAFIREAREAYRYHHPSHRASNARRDGNVGRGDGAGPWGEDCRGAARRNPEQREGDRGLSWQPQGRRGRSTARDCRRRRIGENP